MKSDSRPSLPIASVARCCCLALALAVPSALPLASAAQPAATTPIRLIVPLTPSTGIDLIARQVAHNLAERLGRPVVVENRAGASGNLGTEAVVRAAPDGSTLLVAVNTLLMNRAETRTCRRCDAPGFHRARHRTLEQRATLPVNPWTVPLT